MASRSNAAHDSRDRFLAALDKVTDVELLFEHEDFTFEVLESSARLNGFPPISELIKEQWSTDVDRVQAIINPKR